MPRVPTYSNLQVGQSTLPQVQLQGPRAVEMPDVAGQQAQQMGRTLSGVGGELGRQVLQIQEQANQLRIDDALNRVKEEALRLTYDPEVGYANARGANALMRPDGRPLAEEYASKLQERVSAITQDLGNDAQRAAFSAAASGILTNFQGNVLKHEADELNNYALSVSEGVQATALREIELSWSNPEAIDAAITRIKAQTYRQGQILGKSAEWQEARVREITSKAHKTALAAALTNGDAIYADQYLARYADSMQGDDILAVRALVNQEVDLQVGENIGAQVFAQNAPAVAPSDFARLTNIVMNMESNGRRYGADGKILQGPQTRYGTAKGEMQVLDDTNKDPGFGVTPAKDDSPEERARVGRDYLEAMAQRYNGEIDKTLAAYNWGPGNVDKALKEHGENWLAHAPKETRDYVARGAREFGVGAGKPPKPTLAQLKAELRERPELAGNPRRLKQAEARLEADYAAMEAEIKAGNEKAVADAMRELQLNGGDYASLPYAIRSAVPPDKVDTLMDYGKKVNTIQTNPAVYQRLSDPAELASLTEDQFYALRMELSEADWKQFAKRRGGNLADTEKLNTSAIDRALKNRLAELGVDPNPKADTDEYRQLGVIRSIIDKTILGEQAVAKKQFNDTEIEKHIDLLWSTSAELQNAWYQSGDTRRERLLTLEPGDIPSGDRRAIVASYQRMGLPEPDDYEVLRIYIAGQLARGAN